MGKGPQQDAELFCFPPPLSLHMVGQEQSSLTKGSCGLEPLKSHAVWDLELHCPCLSTFVHPLSCSTPRKMKAKKNNTALCTKIPLCIAVLGDFGTGLLLTPHPGSAPPTSTEAQTGAAGLSSRPRFLLSLPWTLVSASLIITQSSQTKSSERKLEGPAVNQPLSFSPRPPTHMVTGRRGRHCKNDVIPPTFYRAGFSTRLGHIHSGLERHNPKAGKLTVPLDCPEGQKSLILLLINSFILHN